MNSETCEKVAAFCTAVFGLATCSTLSPTAAISGGAAAVLSVPSVVRAMRLGNDKSLEAAVSLVKSRVEKNWKNWSEVCGELTPEQLGIASAKMDMLLPHLSLSAENLIGLGREINSISNRVLEHAAREFREDYAPLDGGEQAAINGRFLLAIVEGAIASLDGTPSFEAEIAPWFQRELFSRIDRIELALAKAPAIAAQIVIDEAATRQRREHTISLRNGAAVLNPLRARIRPTELLVARYQVAPFVDRGGYLEDLLDWAGQPDWPRARGKLIVAPGGSGKTRIAIELVRSLEARGWIATFYSARNASPTLVADLVRLLETPDVVGVLIAIDYSESQQEVLRQVASAAANLPIDGPPVRIVALARSQHGWWNTFSRDESVSQVFEIEPLTALAKDLSENDRLSMFEKSKEAFRTALDDLFIPTAQTETSENVVSNLTPLDVAASAYLVVRGYTWTSSEGVFESLYQEERLHWRRALAAETDDAPSIADLARAAAQVTLVNGARENAVRRLLAADRSPRILSDEGLLVALRRLYARSIGVTTDGERREETMIGSILPDRLGEHIAMRVAASTGTTLVQDTFLTALDTPPFFTSDAGMVLTTCRRALRKEHDDAVREAATQMIDGLAEVVEILTSEQSEALLTSLPGTSVALGKFATQLADHLVRLTADAGDGLSRSKLAYRLTYLAQRLGYQGRFQHAVEPIRQAAVIARDLYLHDPGEHGPLMGRVMNDLGYHLNNVGLKEEARLVTHEAVSAYRLLIRQNRSEFVEPFALALNNQAFHAAECKDYDEAVQASLEAKRAYEGLPQADREAVLGDYALAVYNLGEHYRLAGNHRQAVTTSNQALDLYRSLYDADPDVYASWLSAAHAARSLLEWDDQNADSAVRHVDSSIALRRDAYASNPELFGSRLARSLVYKGRFSASNSKLAQELANEAIGLLLNESAARTKFAELLLEAALIKGESLLAVGRRGEASKDPLLRELILENSSQLDGSFGPRVAQLAAALARDVWK